MTEFKDETQAQNLKTIASILIAALCLPIRRTVQGGAAGLLLGALFHLGVLGADVRIYFISPFQHFMILVVLLGTLGGLIGGVVGVFHEVSRQKELRRLPGGADASGS